MEIETSFREALLKAIRPLPEYECFESGLCSIGDVKVSGCERFTGGRKKRAVGLDSITTIECTVVFRSSKGNASAPNAAEKAGSVAFQLQYVVSMGQFTMNISENVLVARQGSLQHLTSEFTCGLGYFTDIGNSSCGKRELKYFKFIKSLLIHPVRTCGAFGIKPGNPKNLKLKRFKESLTPSSCPMHLVEALALYELFIAVL